MKGNLFQNIPQSLKEEKFENLFQNNNLKIERIISQGQITPEEEWYDQDKEEWVVLLKGIARINFGNNHFIDLKEGDYLHIPAHQKHRVEYTSTDPKCIWLAIHY